jgi:hypothetical protein
MPSERLDKTLPRLVNAGLPAMLDSGSDWPGFEMMQTGCS